LRSADVTAGNNGNSSICPLHYAVKGRLLCVRALTQVLKRYLSRPISFFGDTANPSLRALYAPAGSSKYGCPIELNEAIMPTFRKYARSIAQLHKFLVSLTAVLTVP
jgi:hypothetical protein